MDSTRTAERGFSLLELTICAGLLALAGAATAGALAAVARAASPPAARDAALGVAENVLARARAAVAYAPPGDRPAGTPPGDRTWALNAGTTRFAVAAALGGAAACGGGAPLVVPLPVTATYDPAAERFTVAVAYPRDPCAVPAGGADAEAATVVLTQTLPPSAVAPGTTFRRAIPTPARM